MEEYRFSDDVYEQIKDFSWLTEEQDLLVDKLILNKEIKERYIKFRLTLKMNDLENVEYLAKGGFGIVYKAIWRQGRIHTWNFDSNRWKRFRSERVVLKYIYNSQDNIAEFLREVESHVIANLGGSRGVIRCYGIIKIQKKMNI
ncbi:unnamed protein product [Rhizophagus irregularis]|nr:unnamed protein product [Rhizophagus irregularis]